MKDYSVPKIFSIKPSMSYEFLISNFCRVLNVYTYYVALVNELQFLKNDCAAWSDVLIVPYCLKFCVIVYVYGCYLML